MHNPKIEPKRFTKKVKMNNITRKRYTTNHKTVMKKIINTYLVNNSVSYYCSMIRGAMEFYYGLFQTEYNILFFSRVKN